MTARTLNLLDLVVLNLRILAFTHTVPVHKNSTGELGILILELYESILHEDQTSNNTNNRAGWCTDLYHCPDIVDGFLARRLYANLCVVPCCTLVHRCHQASDRRPAYGTWRRMGNIATYGAEVNDGLKCSAVNLADQPPCKSSGNPVRKIQLPN